jgi:hypothetical protein
VCNGSRVAPACSRSSRNTFRIESRELSLYRFAYITLGWVLREVESLDLEFTFPIRSSNIEYEFSSKPLGAGNFTDTAMLIPLMTDFHFATISTMVFTVFTNPEIRCMLLTENRMRE